MKKHPLSDLDAEIRDHIARETQDNIDRGMSEDNARAAAMRRFGNSLRVREDAREVWVPAWLDHLRQDARFALRGLVRDPVFSCATLLTLAFGIGLTTAMFSVVHSVLLRPLPYADAGRIVLIRETLRGRAGSASAGHFHDWSTQTTTLEATAAALAATFNLTGAGEPERITGMRVTPGYFDIARMPAAVGRYFTAVDLENDARPAVLGFSLWQRRFSGDPSVVGRTIWLNGDPHVVIGIAPAGFALTDPTRSGVTGGFSADIWTGLPLSAIQTTNYGNHAYLVLGRRKPGVTLDATQADLERITEVIAGRQPDAMAFRGVLVTDLREALVGSYRNQLMILLAAAGLVLTIGCINISNLLLARATARSREMAIRLAIGGGRRRIVRQLLAESLVLGAHGGVGAIAVAAATIQFCIVRGPAYVPRLADAGLHFPIVIFAAVTTAVASIACGLAPAVRVTRIDLQTALRDGSGSGGRPRGRARHLLVVSQVALTVVILLCTGLLLRSATHLSSVPLGFNAHNLLVGRMTLPTEQYSDAASVADAYRIVLSRLREISGAEVAALATTVPLAGGGPDAAIAAEGVDFPDGAAPSPHIRLISDGYDEALGVPVVRGRALRSQDLNHESPSVVLINERLAKALWPKGDALGKRISTWTATPQPEWREVIGIVADVRAFGQAESAPFELFIPFTQAPTGSWNVFQRSMVLMLRPNQDWPEEYAAPMRAAVSAVNASIPLYDVRTMEQVVATATSPRRFYLRLVLVLAVSALGLAVLGLYGVIAQLVIQRRTEIGLRMAIGAPRSAVLWLFMKRGLQLAVLGVSVGVPVGLLLSRVMRNLLFGVSSADPLTIVAVVLLLILTSLSAALVPAVRAARMDPLNALRYE